MTRPWDLLPAKNTGQRGPRLGALIFTVLPEILRPFAEYKEFLSGGLLLTFLIFLPRGIAGMIRQAAQGMSPRLKLYLLPLAPSATDER